MRRAPNTGPTTCGKDCIISTYIGSGSEKCPECDFGDKTRKETRKTSPALSVIKPVDGDACPECDFGDKSRY